MGSGQFSHCITQFSLLYGLKMNTILTEPAGATYTQQINLMLKTFPLKFSDPSNKITTTEGALSSITESIFRSILMRRKTGELVWKRRINLKPPCNTAEDIADVNIVLPSLSQISQSGHPFKCNPCVVPAVLLFQKHLSTSLVLHWHLLTCPKYDSLHIRQTVLLSE